ncbi:MAG: hypothetical protein Q9217_002897, partial [Psora testacea]
MATEENAALRHKFELLKGAEQHKNALIEELLRRLDQLTDDYHQEKLDHARESHFNRDVQLREIQLQDELRRFKALMRDDNLLIDGDGMIFDDKLIAKGEAGGKDAAGLLWSAVTADVHRRVPNLGSDYKVVTRIYANLKGLGDVCNRSGIMDHPMLMEDFARGFTGSKQLFDFVDVGTEIFKLHLYDCHCRHIFFGCSHDNGYARLLEDVAETSILNSITLLEGVPFERELDQLKSKYQTTRFEGLFRTEKISIYKTQFREPLAPATAPPQSNGLPPPPAQYQSPYQPNIAPSNLMRTPSASTNSTTPLNPTAPSWAALATKPAIASPPPTPQPTTAKTSATVPRNRFGQRIDPV